MGFKGNRIYIYIAFSVYHIVLLMVASFTLIRQFCSLCSCDIAESKGRKKGGREILICAIERFSIWDRELVGLVMIFSIIFVIIKGSSVGSVDSIYNIIGLLSSYAL